VRVGSVWRAAVATAGAPHGTGFHDLRHFYASLLIRDGEGVRDERACKPDSVPAHFVTCAVCLRSCDLRLYALVAVGRRWGLWKSCGLSAD
jgi:hypothetical protein